MYTWPTSSRMNTHVRHSERTCLVVRLSTCVKAPVPLGSLIICGMRLRDIVGVRVLGFQLEKWATVACARQSVSVLAQVHMQKRVCLCGV